MRREPAGKAPSEAAADGIDLSPIETHLGFLLRLAQQSVFDEFHRRFSAEGMTPARFSVLTLVAATPGLRQIALSKGLHIKPPNVAVLIDAMEQGGLIERQTFESNRRERRLFLTDAGRKLHVRLAPRVAEMEAEFVRGLNPDELHGLRHILRRIQSAVL